MRRLGGAKQSAPGARPPSACSGWAAPASILAARLRRLATTLAGSALLSWPPGAGGRKNSCGTHFLRRRTACDQCRNAAVALSEAAVLHDSAAPAGRNSAPSATSWIAPCKADHAKFQVPLRARVFLKSSSMLGACNFFLSTAASDERRQDLHQSIFVLEGRIAPRLSSLGCRFSRSPLPRGQEGLRATPLSAPAASLALHRQRLSSVATQPAPALPAPGFTNRYPQTPAKRQPEKKHCLK